VKSTGYTHQSQAYLGKGFERLIQTPNGHLFSLLVMPFFFPIPSNTTLIVLYHTRVYRFYHCRNPSVQVRKFEKQTQEDT